MTTCFLGGELGGRPADRSCYDESGRVLYDRVAETDAFDDGLRALMHRADAERVALMCSEKDPLDCHRDAAGRPRPCGSRRRRARTSLPMAASKTTTPPWTAWWTRTSGKAIWDCTPTGTCSARGLTIVAEAMARRAGKVAYKSDTAASVVGLTEVEA